MRRIDQDEAIQIICEETQVLLSKDDPLLIIYHMNEIQINNFQAALEKEMKKFHSMVMEQVLDLQQGIDENITGKINAAVNAHKRAMDDSLSEVSQKAAKDLNRAIQPLLSECQNWASKSLLPAYLNITTAVITFLAVMLLVYTYVSGVGG